jgi:hypothetical protein
MIQYKTKTVREKQYKTKTATERQGVILFFTSSKRIVEQKMLAYVVHLPKSLLKIYFLIERN